VKGKSMPVTGLGALLYVWCKRHYHSRASATLSHVALCLPNVAVGDRSIEC
jgi:hypothetical protein